MNPQDQGMPQAYNPYTMGPPTPIPTATPATPAAPVAPAAPTTPVAPATPVSPVTPATPTAPVSTGLPMPPATPAQTTSLAQAVNTATNQPFSADDTAAAASTATVQPTMTTSADTQPLSPINNAQTTPKQPATSAQTAGEDNPLSTQATLQISELRDGLVIMKDGSFRAVIACQSINFDLMSEAEREAVEYSYQDFLNSLNFTTQILIRSQRVDIGPYIERLTEIRKNNDNMLLGVLMDDYIDFIDRLSQEANIMDKSFFIVIPYYTSAEAEKVMTQTRNFFSGISTKNKTPEVFKIDRATYDKAITEINNRVETVVSGLFNIGVRSVRLNTRELGALYYNFNNPDTAVREPLVDFTKLATTYVKKGEKENV